MRRLIALFLLTACIQTPVQPLAEGTYRLVSIDQTPFTARATISFPAPDQIAGNAPCNSYNGPLAVPLPQFSSNMVAATEMACDDLPAEMEFFAAMSAMTQAQVTATQVTLSNAAGRSMVFVQP